MSGEREDGVTASTFSNIYSRIAHQIVVNKGVLDIANWAQTAAAPYFQALVASNVQSVLDKFPSVPPDAASIENVGIIASQDHKNAVSAVNAAALVFGHTITDSVADDLLEIAARRLPERWHADDEEFKVTLSELRKMSVEEYSRRALDRLVQRQKSKSLPSKVQYLFTLSRCGPAAFGIDLDTELLENADRIRHEIVHGGNFGGPNEKLYGMLGALLLAAHASLFAVAHSCGYCFKSGVLGTVFSPTLAEE